MEFLERLIILLKLKKQQERELLRSSIPSPNYVGAITMPMIKSVKARKCKALHLTIQVKGVDIIGL